MRRALLLLVACLLPAPVFAQWAPVSGQTDSTNGDDQEMAFPSPIGSGNVVIITASVVGTAQTVSITGSTFAISAVAGFPMDVGGGSNARKVYVFCGVGDGTDGTFTITTSGTANALANGQAFSGGDCTLDGTAQGNDDSDDTNYALTTDVTTSLSSSLLIGVIRSTSAASFTPGPDMTQFGSGGAQASAYRILGGAGSYDPTWTSAATEIALIAGVAFAATAADTTNPTVSTLSPADDATGVSLTTNLVVTFDETVVKGTGNILIKHTVGDTTFETIDVTSALVTVNGTQVTINPAGTLVGSTGYYVQIAATAFDDIAGNSYAGIADTTSWSFTTEAAASGRPCRGGLRLRGFGC